MRNFRSTITLAIGFIILSVIVFFFKRIDGFPRELALVFWPAESLWQLLITEVGKGTVPPGPVELNWDLAIGEDLAGGPNEQLRGNVDDVLILGRTMSDAEVKALSARRRQ